MSKPLVSIIVPVFNRRQIIKTTLNSILNQTYKNWECIVVDDGSDDSTEDTINEYLKRDNRIQFYKRPESLQKGSNSCRNYGFTLAKGKYVNWFDSDDIMMSTFLEQKVEAFKANTDAVIHRNNYANYQLERYRESKFEYKNGNSLFYNYAMENIEIQTCGFMWNREFLEGKPLFDTQIMRYQDNEFHIRMLAVKTLNVIIIDNILATIRSGDGHASQISAKENITKNKLYDVFFYRYQCLKLAKECNIDVGGKFHKTISKKALWAFYAGLRFEKKIIERMKDYGVYFAKLYCIYSSPQIKLMDIAKSQLYLFKIILFR
ncbi:glycosyltransferase family 2 protein [Hyunsoonleella ulvae]|uniref:glycosyltransferase family 2 protein n=1 Tax=Hyunsoonleella ulvae TaxID=2799948 RepID=UPI00193A439A|nr:glycosyltransferase family 2 protein [Hyunsoonleella ulvae]